VQCLHEKKRAETNERVTEFAGDFELVFVNNTANLDRWLRQSKPDCFQMMFPSVLNNLMRPLYPSLIK
jgi:hypothetical protein